MEKRFPPIRCLSRMRQQTDETRDAVLRYLALIAFEVTSGKLDPARVNWQYLRDNEPQPR
ncbi:hypothetical protein [Quatrionicoccus australiensis]|uniref:hypothetical protein n=1 Tax=Quatrionicoccus australiensis TaxID=138118 RepID=UPI001CF864AE|nr:hypothetical protein [Quatrionicoccus australiensis]UCV15554.1 hypothetical protein KI612_02285 [Quatrionicoccus australiensis]